MDRWKAEQGRGREKRKIRREKIREEKESEERRCRFEKVGKLRNTVFFQWFVAPEGRKVGSLKRRVRSQLARWEMKNFTPLWREAHFEVKKYKAPHVRATFGGSDVEKVHALVARSAFEVKMYKTPHVRAKIRVQHFRFASPASCHIFLSLWPGSECRHGATFAASGFCHPN